MGPSYILAALSIRHIKPTPWSFLLCDQSKHDQSKRIIFHLGYNVGYLSVSIIISPPFYIPSSLVVEHAYLAKLLSPFSIFRSQMCPCGDVLKIKVALIHKQLAVRNHLCLDSNSLPEQPPPLTAINVPLQLYANF